MLPKYLLYCRYVFDLAIVTSVSDTSTLGSSTVHLDSLYLIMNLKFDGLVIVINLSNITDGCTLKNGSICLNTLNM